MIKKRVVIKYIFQSGVGAVFSGGFSHRRSYPAERAVLRNSHFNIYQPIEFNVKKEKQKVVIT